MYHLMSRGDRKEAIFEDDEDRVKFLQTLGETCMKAEWQVHAYCLMGNHFHLVVETPKPTLVSGMKWLLGTYTQRFNARHRVRGHLFAGRYKSLIVDGSDNFYLRVVCDYVHLNPLRAGLLGKGEPLDGYMWSSFPEYLKTPRKRLRWLRVDRLMGEHGIDRDNTKGRREFRENMANRCGQEGHAEEELWAGIRRGWKFGAEDFVERLAEVGKAITGKQGSHLSEEREETMEAKAHGVIRSYLAEGKIGKEDFLKLKKGDPKKVQLAAKLRRETTMTMAWIGRELNAGVPQTLWKALWAANIKGDVTRD